MFSSKSTSQFFNFFSFLYVGTGFVTKAFLDNHTRMVHAGISLGNIQISKVITTTNSEENKLPNSIPPNPSNLQKVVVINPANLTLNSNGIRILKQEKAAKQPITISQKPVVALPKMPTAVSAEKLVKSSENVNRIVKQEMINKSTSGGGGSNGTPESYTNDLEKRLRMVKQENEKLKMTVKQKEMVIVKKENEASKLKGGAGKKIREITQQLEVESNTPAILGSTISLEDFNSTPFSEMQNLKNGIDHPKNYKCVQCDKFFGNLEEVKKHMTTSLHSEYKSNDETESNRIAQNRIIESTVDITEHNIKEEKSESRKTFKKSVNCQFCDQPFDSEKILEKHMQNDHGVTPPQSSAGTSGSAKRIKLENVNEKIVLHQNKTSPVKERQHFKKRKLPAVKSEKSDFTKKVKMEKNINEVTEDNSDIVVLDSDDDKENELEGCEQDLILGI